MSLHNVSISDNDHAVNLLFSVVVCWFGIVGCALAVPPRFAAIFADHMVVQRGVPIPVWGWADPEAQVTVSFSGQTQSATAGMDGKWTVRFAPLECPQDNPGQSLSARSEAEVTTLSDILIGDVWICGGQSNMAFKLSRATNGPAAAAAASHPLIRICDVSGKRTGPNDAPPQDLEPAAWKIASPASVADFSAIAYFFAKNLQSSISVPIGLVDTSVGGTAMKSWMSREVMAADPILKAEVLRDDEAMAQFPQRMEDYHRKLESYQQRANSEKQPARKPTAPKGPDSSYRLSYLHASVIRPLQPFAIKGVIWYQGEADAGRHAIFQHQFATLVSEWRREWGQGEFPWLYVQLAPYSKAEGRLFPRVWEAQTRAQIIPNSAMIVALDHGISDNIHPPDKQAVGERLALAARGLAYHETVSWRSPFFKSMEKQGSDLVVHFDAIGDGLSAADPELKYVSVAGSDRKFLPASARLMPGNTLLVNHPEIKDPIAVRYGWYAAGDPVGASIFGKNGLPVAPFRSDDWPEEP